MNSPVDFGKHTPPPPIKCQILTSYSMGIHELFILHAWLLPLTLANTPPPFPPASNHASDWRAGNEMVFLSPDSLYGGNWPWDGLEKWVKSWGVAAAEGLLKVGIGWDEGLLEVEEGLPCWVICGLFGVGVGFGWHTLLTKVGIGWYVGCCCCRLGRVGIGLLDVEVDRDGICWRLSKVYMEVGGWWRLLCRFARSWCGLTWRLKFKFARGCGQLRQWVACMGRVEMDLSWRFWNVEWRFVGD